VVVGTFEQWRVYSENAIGICVLAAPAPAARGPLTLEVGYMQQATRYALWLAAAIVVGAALVSALRQLSGIAPVDAVFTCALALGGLGLGYLGTLFGVQPSGPTCEEEGYEHAQEAQSDLTQMD
jgi:hypothetical protein